MVTRETISYKGQNYHRYPDSKRRQLRVYFWRHDKWKSPPFALHRQIWIDSFGPIPPGQVIHHKDGNPLNNLIENLELKGKGAHNRDHMLLPEIRAKSVANGIKQTERLKRQLREWRENNPELAKQVYRQNGLTQSERLKTVLKKWREENPEKFKEMVKRNGYNSGFKKVDR